MSIISTYLPRVNSKCFRTINSIRTNLGMRPFKDSKLLEKIEKADVVDFSKNIGLKVPKEAKTYSYVKIGKKSDNVFSREIVSFFDSQKRLISRVFQENGINVKQRLYSYKKKTRIIQTREYSTSRLPETYRANIDICNKLGDWHVVSLEKQIKEKVSEFVKEGKKALQLLTRRVDYDPKDMDFEQITYTKYPLNLGFGKKSDKQVLSAKIKKRNKDVEISELKQTANLGIDESDEFLKYRILDPRTADGMEYLTYKFLRDKNLDKLYLRVYPLDSDVGKNSAGYFSARKSQICYSPVLENYYPEDVVAVVAHETEHAYQHSLIGRVGKGINSYEYDALREFGPIEYGDNNFRKSIEYAIARDEYPSYSATEDLSRNRLYQENLLEVDAFAVEEPAKKAYTKNLKNFEFFDQF